MTKERLLRLIEKYKPLGMEYVPETGAILIGRAPHIGPEAWLNSMYDTVSEGDVEEMEQSMGRKIPSQYRDFLLSCSNGLNIVSTSLCLFGQRKMVGRDIVASRQPFDLVTLNRYKSERPRNAPSDSFFFGGYDWDGSQVYFSCDGKVHFCAPDDSKSLREWDSLDDFLISEIHRIHSLFDDNGVELDDSNPTIPVPSNTSGYS